MSVLITGGLGFIGANLTDRLLHDGRQVVVFDNASRPGSRHNLEWLRSRHGKKFRFDQGDVRNFPAVEAAIRDAEIVFHLAAQVAVTTSVANPREDFEVNALGTLNVLEAARQLHTRPVILLTSTNKVYGGMEHLRIVESQTRYEMPDYQGGISETFPLDFHSPYGCSKGAADQYVRDFYRIYGLPTVVFRMSCIYGPRQFGTEDQGWLAHFVLTARRGSNLTIYGDGKQVRDVLYVDDLIDAMLRATSRLDRTAGQVYNIGGGPQNAISVWAEFSRHLVEAIQPLPPVEFRDWRPGDQRIYVSDIRRAAQHFQWQPQISVKEGISRLASWAEEALELLARKS